MGKRRLFFIAVIILLCHVPPVDKLFAQGGVSFLARRDYTVGRVPNSAAVGDFNGDGHQDLAVANGISQDISVLLGFGDGTFQAARNVSIGDYILTITVGDFNRDGRQDLVVASGNLLLLLGNGDGTFQVARSLGVPGGYITAGDFNGDNFQDLAVTGMDSISILLGNGDGTFRAAGSFGAGRNPKAIIVGDFNEDRIQDLAVANQTSDGTLQVAQSIRMESSVRSVLVGDFNGDKIPDLVVTSGDYSSRGGAILLGNGDGTFRSTLDAWLRGSSITVGDFNGDDISDLAVLAVSSGEIGPIYVLLGQGDGTFRWNGTFESRNYPSAVTVGDFNGDKIQDLAVINANLCCGNLPGTVAVLLGNGNGTFRPAEYFVVERQPTSIAVGDFNEDDRQDLVVASLPKVVSILINNSR